MILRQIELKRFGKFDERSLEFRRGINVIVGPNEAGKSTMMEAIPAVLFGLRDKERFRKWGRSAECEAALVFDCGSCTVRIERNILTDRILYKETDDLYNTLYEFEGKVAPLGRSSERMEYYSRLADILGVVENDLFRASVFFGQGQLEFSTKGGVADRVKALLSGYLDVDYDAVLTSLSEDYFKITSENPWGKDKTKDREYEEVCSRLRDVETEKSSLQNQLEEIALLRDKISELTQAIETDKSDAAKGQNYLNWVRRQWHLEEQQEKLKEEFSRLNLQMEKVETLIQRQNALQTKRDSLGIPSALADDLPALLKEADETKQRLIQLQEEGNSLRQELIEQVTPSRKISILLTTATLIPGIVIALMSSEYRAYSLLISVLIISMIWAIHVWRSGDIGAHMGGLKGQLRVVELGREQAQIRLAEIDQILENSGLSPSAAQKDKLQEKLGEYRNIRNELQEISVALRVLDDPEPLKKSRDSVVRELAVLSQRIEQEKPLKARNILSLEELPEAEETLHKLQASLLEKEKELEGLIRQEMALSTRIENLAQLDREWLLLTERKKNLEHRKSVLATAFEVLSSSVEDFRKTYLDRFLSDIGRYLGTLSSGTYQEVSCNEDFDFSLKTAQGWKSLEHFSQGTRDAVFLAIRFALSRHLAGGKTLPFLLDDPLVNLDRIRLTETLKALERLSNDHQIVLFTHDEGILKRATRERWHCVSLEDVRADKQNKTNERSEDVSQLCLL